MFFFLFNSSSARLVESTAMGRTDNEEKDIGMMSLN
jgi:hypothetical protein